jgi:hypothetical protein
MFIAFRSRVMTGFASFASQGTNFGRSEQREVSGNNVMTGLEHAARLKKDQFSYGAFSISGHSMEEREESIDFDSSLKVTGCAGGSGGQKKTKASSTVTSGPGASSGSYASSGDASKSAGSSSSGSGSGQGSSGGEDCDGSGGKKQPPTGITDHSDTDSAAPDEEEELEEQEEFARRSATRPIPSGSSLLRKKVVVKATATVKSHVRQGTDVQRATHQSLMDNRVRQAGDEEGGGEVVNEEDQEEGLGENEVGLGENELGLGKNEAAVLGLQPARTTTEGNFIWRPASALNQETFPVKSKASYLEAYRHFETFLKANGEYVEGKAPSEEAFLNYFSYLKIDRHFASTTIWCTSAKLNACLKRKFGIRLQDFPNVSELMKTFDSDHEVKKAKNFSPQEV